MSVNQQTDKPADPSPTAPPKASRLDLSFTKIIGGALAAMTAAALGSRLSVAGTIAGAALASIVAAVAGAIYTASLKHTQDKVRTVFTGRTGADQPTAVEVIEVDREADTPTTVLSAPTRADIPQWDEPLPAGASAQPERRISWKSVLVGALAAFAIAAVTLTGIELATGRALSGGEGTTITQVSEPKAPKPTKKPAASASPSDTPSAEASESSEPSPTPTSSATQPADPEPSQTASSTPTPSASASATSSASQTPSVAPSDAPSAPEGVR